MTVLWAVFSPKVLQQRKQATKEMTCLRDGATIQLTSQCIIIFENAGAYNTYIYK